MNSKDITIVAIYSFVGKSPKEEHFIHLARSMGERFMIGGDFKVAYLLGIYKDNRPATSNQPAN